MITCCIQVLRDAHRALTAGQPGSEKCHAVPEALQLAMGKGWTGTQGSVPLKLCVSELLFSPDAEGLHLLVHAGYCILGCTG